MSASVIICLTDIGKLSRLIAKYRPYSQVIVLTGKELANQCQISRSCNGLYLEGWSDRKQVIKDIVEKCKKSQVVRPGDDIVFISGIWEEEIFT